MSTSRFTTCDLISAAFEFLGESGGASTSADLAKAYRDLAHGHGAATSPATLLLDLHEHLFCTPDDNQRLQRLHAHAGSRVLDYGCGAGFYALHLARSGREVTCRDFDQTKLDFIRHAAHRFGLAERIRFDEAAPFDTVVCINVLDHTPDPAAMIDDIAGKLVTGGLLCLFAHFEDDGEHTSDAGAIDSAFDRLAVRFRRAPEDVQLVPLLEFWEKRAAPADARGRLDDAEMPLAQAALLRPLRHPDLFKELAADGSTVVQGDQFYLRPASLNAAAIAVLAACDGRRSVAEIAAMAELDIGPTVVILRELFRLHFILPAH